METNIYTDPREKFVAPALFLGLAVTYNAFLAIINAHVMHVSQDTVVATEGIIILGVIGYLTTKMRYLRNCQPVFLFQLVMLSIFLAVTIFSEYINVKAFRDIFLITVFTLLGTLSSERSIVRLYTALAAMILAFLLLEAYVTEIYAMTFNPASYYAATRGLENPDFNESGLFASALSFEGRFSLSGTLGITHRLSSLFLEQVSLGNFAIVLTVFTSLLWKKTCRKQKFLLIFTILFTLLSNNSRTAYALCFLILIGHSLFPKLPRLLPTLYLPISLLVVLVFFNIPECIQDNGHPILVSDDLKGRLGLAACTLMHLKMENLLGFESIWARPFWDSGYVYFINGQSLFGLIVFWMYCSFLITPRSSNAIRANHYLAITIFINMFTSMALFSIKVAGPFWFLIGHIYMKQKQEAVSSYAPQLPPANLSEEQSASEMPNECSVSVGP